MINKEMKLREIIEKEAAAIEVFNELNIDFCCGGHDSLEKASMEKNLNVDSILKLIEEKAQNSNHDNKTLALELDDFKKLSIDQMLDNLIKTHHKIERDLLVEIDPLINKILLVHYTKHTEQLVQSHKLFGMLKTELEEHFAKEEKVIFPLIKQNPSPSKETLEKVQELEGEHENAGDIIKKLQEVTDNFTPPKDGCNTYKKTFSKLKELVEDVFLHIYKENSILFIRYQAQ